MNDFGKINNLTFKNKPNISTVHFFNMTEKVII